MFGNTATATLLLQAGADPLHGMGSIADPGLAHTQTLLADRATVPATLDHLRVHALRHLGDQPTLAARILELIAARPAP
jgi:hypothetical protein